MAAEKFTIDYLRKLKPAAKPYEKRSANVRGLLVRVQPTGKRTFYFEHERGKRSKVGRNGDEMIQNLTLGQIKVEAAKVQAAGPPASRKERSSVTLGGFVHGEYADYISDKVLTHEAHISCIERNFSKLYTRRMDEIQPLDIERWRKARLKQAVKKSNPKKLVSFETIKRDYACLRACLNTAMQTFQYIGTHQLLNYRLEPPTASSEHGEKKVRYLTPAEELRLRDAMEARESAMKCVDHVKPIVLLALNTGLRRGDIFALQWSHIDLSAKTLTKVIRKTRRHRTEHVTLPLSKEATAVLRQWKKHATGELVFASPITGGPLDNIDSAWKRLLKDAKIKGFRFHDLRHTYATRLIDSGVPLYTVKELLTHSDISQTQVYAHVTDAALRQAVNRLGA